MWPVMVVIAPEVLDDDTGFGQRPELLPVETFVAEAAMNALDEPVQPKTGGLDVDRLNLVLSQPPLDLPGDELGPIITAQELGCPVFGDGLAHPFEHVSALQSAVGPQHMTLARVLVQDR